METDNNFMNGSTQPLTRLQKTLAAVHGKKGQLWWDQLPSMLDTISHEHTIQLHEPFPNLSFNYVCPASGPNGEAWVLKCGVPNNEPMNEILALQHYDGHGAVRMITSDASAGWLLIEHCKPGKMLVDVKDDRQSILIATTLMQKLWKPVQQAQHFPTIASWLDGLDRMQTHKNSGDLISKPLSDFVFARTKELLKSQGEQVLLHGDFHHYNILQHDNEWMVIDPKGVIGEREYEIGALLRNPLDVIEAPIDVQKVINHLDLIVELTKLDRERVLSWSIIQAVLCAWWHIEDALEDKAQGLISFATELFNAQHTRR